MMLSVRVLFESAPRVWCVAALGTTTRVTYVLLTAMRTSQVTVTTTLAFVVPELTKGLDDPILEQSDILSARVGWRKAVADSVLVGAVDANPNAHYRLFILGQP